MRKIGEFTKTIIDLLGLDIDEGTPIYIGESNISHMKERHQYEFELYFPHIEEILRAPDYVGFNSKHGSIDFVKVFQIGNDHVQVSVKVTASGTYFARTLFVLMTYKAERFIENGTLKRVP